MEYAPRKGLKRENGQSTIMLLLPQFRETFIPTLQGVQDTCKTVGFNLFPVIGYNGDEDIAKQPIINALRQHMIHGVVWAAHPDAIIERIIDSVNIPSVYVMRPFTNKDKAEIMIDNYKIGVDMATHLMKNGYKCVATLGNTQNHHRFIGLRDTLERNNCSVYADYGWFDVAKDIWTRNQAFELISGFFSSNRIMPDAFFCETDQIALGVLEALKEKGVEIPAQIGVAGCEDTDITLITNPTLTSVALPRYEQGVQAVLLLNQLLSGEAPGHVLLNGRVVERESTRRT